MLKGVFTFWSMYLNYLPSRKASKAIRKYLKSLREHGGHVSLVSHSAVARLRQGQTSEGSLNSGRTLPSLPSLERSSAPAQPEPESHGQGWPLRTPAQTKTHNQELGMMLRRTALFPNIMSPKWSIFILEIRKFIVCLLWARTSFDQTWCFIFVSTYVRVYCGRQNHIQCIRIARLLWLPLHNFSLMKSYPRSMM